mgnify:CR=1 FL=1
MTTELKIPDKVKEIVAKFEKAKAEIYIVSGASRDLLLEREVTDWDFTTNLTPEEMKKNGCNFSLVHTDFMIGSEVINVTGVTQDGKKIEIIKDGEFKI